ncbi:MAG: acyl-CoA-binding protein [Gammaproteobacteria bacterium]|nr:acyl-CoA-binding protein [Gammaproteobacteria bacterium]
MTEINSRFKQAGIAAKSLPERPDNDTMLQLYSLYKQGSAGDVSGEKPGFFDFVATAKYEAWEKIKGLSPDDAKNQYIDLVQNLGGKIED